jgi:hypothetical protein
MSVFPFKPPFSYESFPAQGNDGKVYRIRDSQDNAVCRTYVEENAEIVVRALNAAVDSTAKLSKEK